ncbi:MAG: hypothetical protein ACE5H3_04505, partial [Planctomycetota bacterium]
MTARSWPRNFTGGSRPCSSRSPIDPDPPGDAIEETLRQLGQTLLDQPEWVKVLLLALATFLSEDLTCVGAGILAGAGDLLWPTALIG